MPAGYNPFDDTYNDPWNTDPGGTLSQRWWLNPWGIWGMNPPPFGTAGQGGSAPGPRPVDPPMPEPTPPPPEQPLEQPQQPNEGQVSETPQNPTVDESGNPTWSTDVWGNNIPLGEVGFGAGLGAGLAGLAGMGGGGGTGGGDYYTYPSTPPTTPSTGGGGGGDYYTYPSIPTESGGGGGGNAFTYFSDPSSPSTGNYFTNFTTPTGGGGGGGFPVSLFPWLDKLPGLITGGGGGGGGQQQPQQPSQGQQGQQTGKLLAALPMLAAFQGGTTTTPAPYAHLGPHTPVAPVFQPQGRGNPIPSIGQLLTGVK